MMLIDTHAHLYLEHFDSDREETLERAVSAGVAIIILPNIDTSTIDSINSMVEQYPALCFSMMGLHPSSVVEDYEGQLAMIHKELQTGNHIAVGEIGIDLYWDKTFRVQQEKALDVQLTWTEELHLPFAIHMRESYDAIMSVIKSRSRPGLQGVFHCFTGSREQAEEITGMGFHLGIGGVLTYKNSGLPEVLTHVDPRWVVLETDSPYLPPVPYRGKRNESSYLSHLLPLLAETWSTSESEVARITTDNAKQLFNLA